MDYNTFNLRRFGRFFVTDFKTAWADLWIKFVIFAASGIIIYVLTGSFSLLLGGHWHSMTMFGRTLLFVFLLVLLPVVMSIGTYGRLTDRKSGSPYVLIPASVPEKFLSMLANVLVVVPVAFSVVYLGLDWLLCKVDGGCGRPIAGGGIYELVRGLTEEISSNPGAESLKALFNPLLYVDDYFGFILPFLLGAIFFRNGKFIKTVGVLMVVGMAISAIVIPLTLRFTDTLVSSGSFADLPEFLTNHFVLMDTISDTVVNFLLLGGIYLRLNTIKH
ncbi:MAG: hypothetical protein HUJ94_02835 [Bacteroidales bacterium]|nr:hypothetical protein [Bacteroidales bacterium]